MQMEGLWFNSAQGLPPGEDGTRQGQLDPSTDNEGQHKPFFGVKGQDGEKEKVHTIKESEENCSETISDLRGIIKRADAVSPQVADVVEKVMSNDHSLVQGHSHEVVQGHSHEVESKQSYLQSDADRKPEDHGNNHQEDLDDSTVQNYSISNSSFHEESNTNYSLANSHDSSSRSPPSPYYSHDVKSSFSLSPYDCSDTDSIQNYLPNKEGIYFCHLCSFSGTSKTDFEEHMTCHFEHICEHCGYKSRTEGRLKRHIKDFHTDDPPDGFGSKRNMGRPKVFRCKQCDFVATEKIEFWTHSRSHIKEEKVLQCPKCPFVTEYKHHLEYHLRNHFGSKPFKCNKCNYSCVNKSMLNSHMKSHTNVYQYRCADCTYATKYCHSLKLHLRKYNHKPATVLNNDGSLPQGIDAEASGLSLLQKRGPPRGPRGPRKDKFDPFVSHLLSMPPSSIPGMSPGFNGNLMSPYWPLMNQLPNGMHAPPPPPPLVQLTSSPIRAQLPPTLAQRLPTSPSQKTEKGDGGIPGSSPLPFKCNFCSYGSEIKHELFRHVMKVHAAENQDLFSIFGISSEALLEEQSRRLAYTSQRSLKFPPKTPDKIMENGKFQSALHIKTESGLESPKSSPHSWPHESPNENVRMDSVSSRYSMPELGYSAYNNVSKSPKSDQGEGQDIIKQMMTKFGSGLPARRNTINGEIPLDLTKRTPHAVPSPFLPLQQPYDDLPEESVGEENTDLTQNEAEVSSSGENSVSMETSAPNPRKRSRKGKAFKLDTLCLKLQQKQSDSPHESDNDEDEDSEFQGLSADEMDNVNQKIDDPVAMTTDELSPSNSADIDDIDENPLKIDEDNDDEDDERDDENREPLKKKAKSDIDEIHSNLKILNEEGNWKENAIDMQRSLNENISLSKPPTGEASINLSMTKPRTSDASFNLSMNGHKNLQESIETNHMMQMAALVHGRELQDKILKDSNPNGSISNGHDMKDLPFPFGSRPFFPQNMSMPLSLPRQKEVVPGNNYECMYCEIAFRDCVMYTMHMGYHGYKDPFKCNMCGHTSKDKVEFFLHIARAAHN